ncbi:MAG: response regulator [Desulfobacterales bacterium]
MNEKILIVDDDEAFCRLLAERMRHRDMEVETAVSAAEALQLLERKAFDAVLLDLMMPEMDGIEALKRMLEKRPETQVILLTGYPSVSRGVEALKLGALDFILKPVDLNELTEKIRQARTGRLILVEKKNREKIRRILTE